MAMVLTGLERLPCPTINKLDISNTYWFRRASLIAQLVKKLPAMQETPVQCLGREDPLEKGWATPASLLGVFLIAQLVKTLPAMQETPVQLLGWIYLLEKWKSTPVFWLGSQRAGRDWPTFTFGVSLLAQMVKSLPAIQETLVQSLGQEDPWRRKWQPTPVFLSGKSHGQRPLAGYTPWGHKESDTTKQLTHTGSRAQAQ